MNYKKLTSLALSALLLFLNASPVFAVNFKDVKSDYWAYEQINSLTEKGVLAGYPDETFKPDNNVNRAEFTKMIIKTLDKDDMPVNTETIFSDVSPDFWAYEDIIRSTELGLIKGYPDNTFRPFNNITKSEAISIVSKTIKDKKSLTDCHNCVNCKKECDCEEPCVCEEPCNCEEYCNCQGEESSVTTCPLNHKHSKDAKCQLGKFEDKEKIANWAKKSFKKAIKNELYVNHPDKKYLTPNKEMTRAETAALLYKLRKEPSILAAGFKGPGLQQKAEEKTSAAPAKKLKVEQYTTLTEHLPANEYSEEVNEVQIKGTKALILAYNVVPVKFKNGFNSKKAAEGELVNLTFAENLETEEGTKLIPAGSKLVAKITELKNGKLFHKNGKVGLEITNLVTPSGEVYPLTATIQNNELLDKKFGKCNYKRLGIVGGSIAAFGSILGLLIGVLADDVGAGAAIGSIIGGGTGLVAGLAAPGCSIKIPEEQDIFVKINRDLEIDLKK